MAEQRNERIRVPQPLIRTRLPSGRGATEQPNATNDGDAALTARFWVAIAITGVAAGILGDAMMGVLSLAEHLGYGYNHGSVEAAIAAKSALHRVVVPCIAGAVAGPAWYLLRRLTPGEKSEVDDALWSGSGHLSFRRSIGTSVLSEFVVGMGASLGREAAPKLLGGASGSVVSDRFGLSDAQRRLLVACGAGAGLAAVYNVPLGGALFTAEILCGSITLPTILPALACSGIATVTAWTTLHDNPTYADIPNYTSQPRLIVWALILGPVIGLLSAGYLRLIGVLSHHRPAGRRALVAPLIAFAILGLVGIKYPQLFGNGKDLAHSVFVGHGSLALLFILAALKPAMTALCLGSGASGGLLTPVMSTGAVIGAATGKLWSHLWPGTPVGAFALVGAAAAIGAAMQAPITGLALVLELTHTGFNLVIPMLIATVIATAVTRYIDGYSIYSARLPAH